MLDCVVRNEGRPDIVQISGGEPTIHPEFFAVLDLAKERPIKHLMVNTNGVRIAQDAGFRPAARPATSRTSRSISSSTRSTRARSGRCEGPTWSRSAPGHSSGSTSTGSRPRWSSRSRRGSTTIRSARSSILRWAQPCVRGVTFQPVQVAGRVEGFDPAQRPADAGRGPRTDPRAVVPISSPPTSCRCPATPTVWRWPMR